MVLFVRMLLRQRFHVDLDTVDVLNVLQQSPRRVHSRLASGAHVVTRLCGQKRQTVTDCRFRVILTGAKCLVIALTYRGVGPRVCAWFAC